MLKVCNFISAQVTHAEIAFIYTFFRNLYFRKMENAFLPRAENAFSPKGINGISDWLGRNFFADRSAKQFPTCLFLKIYKKILRQRVSNRRSSMHEADATAPPRYYIVELGL